MLLIFSVDKDECQTDDMCGKGVCINMEGGFDCKCTTGFTTGPNGRCIGNLLCAVNITVALFVIGDCCLHSK